MYRKDERKRELCFVVLWVHASQMELIVSVCAVCCKSSHCLDMCWVDSFGCHCTECIFKALLVKGVRCELVSFVY